MTKTTEKKKYEAPRLTVFGSVRNLTGGSGTSFRDGAITNVRF
ncbi:lasso RiPP family leader peptide-containing protein [Qipengyuania nanhaisediminis]